MKKKYENELTIVYNMLDKLEGLKHATDLSIIQKNMITATKSANTYLQKNTMDVENVQTVMDDVQDTLTKANEINEVLSECAPDPDIEEEFENMLCKAASTVTVSAPTVTVEEEIAQLDMPVVPQTRIRTLVEA
jgi:hypothetical protein